MRVLVAKYGVDRESYGGVVVTSSIGLSLPRERLFE